MTTTDLIIKKYFEIGSKQVRSECRSDIQMAVSQNIYRFYRHECCFPYSLSFILVLIIYFLDFFGIDNSSHIPSVMSYSIITGYYIFNVILYRKRLLESENPGFFIAILSVKVVLWGVLLGLLLSMT